VYLVIEWRGAGELDVAASWVARLSPGLVAARATAMGPRTAATTAAAVIVARRRVERGNGVVVLGGWASSNMRNCS
jgi:hypothetical protein